MPKHLASGDEQCGFYYGGAITPPENEAAWQTFIQQFIRFLFNRYGQEEVVSWQFEVWNEPDVFVFWSGSKEEYFRLYEITAKAIKQVQPDLQVGGPATSGSKWIQSFLAYCTEHQVPVDFISTHQYAGDPIGGVEQTEGLEDENPAENDDIPDFATFPVGLFDGAETILDGIRVIMPDKSEMTDLPNDTFRKNAEIVQQQSQGLPVYYSEWNENAIFSSYTNDTRKVAAYLLKTSLAVEPFISGSSIWCFTDIFEEFSELTQEFHGGFGLLSHSGIPKPQFYVLEMMGRLADERLDLGQAATQGECEIAAFANQEKFQIFAYRQKMKNLDLPKEPVSLLVELEEEPSSVALYRIDENHGNPLRLWEELGKPAILSKAQVHDLIEQSKVRKEVVPVVYDDGVLHLEAALGVNDIYFFEIQLAATKKGETNS